MIRVAIVYPSVIVRHGLRSVLEEESNIVVVEETSSLIDFVASTQYTDLLIIDNEEALNLTNSGNVIWGNRDNYSVLVLGETLNHQVQNVFLQENLAWGLLPADTSPDTLFAAIEALSEGLVVIPPDYFNVKIYNNVRTKGDDFLVDELTGRELEVLQLLANGLSNKQIAAKLSISEHTVKFHISSIFNKFDVASRTEAVRMGFRHGLVAL